jgi:SAM-dependent methyltransferase
MTREQPEYVRRNREYWNASAGVYAEVAAVQWARTEPTWGVWSVPESQLRMLPDDLAGRDVIELGCGTAYVSAWMARRGARPVGIDISEAQLDTARRLQREHAVEFELLHGSAEDVPYPDASFDVAISEYGASIWCDPYRWIAEAARLLRPGGRLIFLVSAPLHMLCMPDVEDEPAADRLLRPYFGLHRMEWSDDDSVEFHLPHGERIALLRKSGFEIEELIEVRPPDGSESFSPYASLAWAQKWPTEEVWKVRRCR